MRKIRIKDEDHLYGSARVRARAANGIERADLIRMSEAKDAAEVFRLLGERGVTVIENDEGEPDTEATLDKYLGSEFDLVQGFSPEKRIYGILRYQYDAHNLKTAIKCEARGRAPEDVFIDLGTVKAASVEKAVLERDFSAFPENISKAAPEALESFGKNGDPQVIDLLIDKACFADMLTLAKSFNKPFFGEIVETKIDVTNILTAIRIMKMGADFDFFKSCFIPGGTLGIEFFKKMTDSGEEGYLDIVSGTAYSYISGAVKAGGRLSQAERACENCYIEKLKGVYSKAYGAEVPFAYLALKDAEVRNIRIIIISKKVGLSSAEIQGRLRGI